MKLVKQQINGSDRIVLKENASLEDLRAEATRMENSLGYKVKQDGRLGRYTATHKFFSGKFTLSLEAD
ncbi:MAG: hypothetical protein ABIR80_20110 [Opitutaceae bacterium]